MPDVNSPGFASSWLGYAATIVEPLLQALAQQLGVKPWVSYDPYDIKAHPLVPRAYAVHHRLGAAAARAIHLIGLMAPNLSRRLLGVKPGPTATGYAYLATGYGLLARSDRSCEHLARKALKLLLACQNSRLGWGLPFDWQSSAQLRIPAGETLSYTTYTALEALLVHYRTLADSKALTVAVGAGTELVRTLRQIVVPHGRCLSYSRFDSYQTINTNALLAGALLELGQRVRDPDLSELGRELLRFVMAEQADDGSWCYFGRTQTPWSMVDGYHTAMTLQGLVLALPFLEDPHAALSCFARGLDYYERAFFLRDGTPCLWPHSRYPQDVACVAEAAALGGLVLREPALSEFHERMCKRLCVTLEWACSHLLLADGSFLYRRYPFWRVNLGSIRWGDGMMLRALALALPEST